MTLKFTNKKIKKKIIFFKIQLIYKTNFLNELKF